ncbi:MAG: hypothetical protein OXH01_06455 [Bacteroidetes bacterium]|nr:hypothetical protein [Bacteroidota bacterium]
MYKPCTVTNLPLLYAENDLTVLCLIPDRAPRSGQFIYGIGAYKTEDEAYE